MKKNKMMRAASALMVATLLTTSVISGTFAKYVTSGSASDTARVAKFGVTVTGTGETFAKEYEKDDDNFTVETNTVVSTERDVVAPGTKGTMAAFTITGTPEVAVRVAFTGTLDLGDKWVYSDRTFYCPIEITFTGTNGNTIIKGKDYTSARDFEAAVNNKIATYTKDYAAGTDLSTISGDAPAISWKWAFEGNDNVKDTYLGNQAAKDNAATISLNVTVKVTQID